MSLMDCLPPTGAPGGTPGTTTPGVPTTLVTTVTPGVVGAYLAFSNAGGGAGAFNITLGAPVTAGNTLVALFIDSGQSSAANTAGGWHDIPSAYLNAGVFATGVRAAWKYFPSGGAMGQTPFVTTGGETGLLAVWEINGLDPTFTPNLHSAFTSIPTYSGSFIDLIDSRPPAQGLYLFLAGETALSGTLTSGGALGYPGWTPTSPAQVFGTSYGASACHVAFSSDPGSVEQSLTFVSGAPIGGVMLGLSLPGVVAPGGAYGLSSAPTALSTFTTIKQNGVTVATNALSLNVVGDATLTTDGSGNLTLTLPSHGPYVDVVAHAALSANSLVNFGTSGAQAADAASNLEAHGYIVAAVAAGATARVYTGGPLAGSFAAGTRYFLGAAGALTSAAPTALGSLVQQVGIGATSTTLAFAPKTGTLNE